jgi:hypothetical protein
MVLRVRTPNRACWRRCSGPRDQLGNGGCLRVARKERQGQNRLPGFILYDHHQGRIVAPALFSQLLDCALGIVHPALDTGQRIAVLPRTGLGQG